MTWLADAVAGMYRAKLPLEGVVGKYKRGADEIERTLIPGQSVSEEYGDDGAAITARTHDWIDTDPASLTLEGTVIKPEMGDRFDTDDGRSFAVIYGRGEKVWRWTDQTQQAIRIHTVEQKWVDE